MKLATLKAVGIFTSEAAIIPIKMQNYYKEINENGTIKEICEILKSNKQHASVHIVALECISLLICPVYGDFYSFPWKRGPHDNINEYIEANITFDSLRQNIYNNIKDSDFVGKAL